MNDEEILKKYHIEIEQGINEIVEEYTITDSARKERVAQKYKEGFITGFKKGVEKTAIAMLKQKLDDSLIKSVTGFSQDDLNKLKANCNHSCNLLIFKSLHVCNFHKINYV